jgi:hypothetical protein
LIRVKRRWGRRSSKEQVIDMLDLIGEDLGNGERVLVATVMRTSLRRHLSDIFKHLADSLMIEA